VHVLEIPAAVNTSTWEVFTVWMVAVLVTAPPAPRVPWVLTVIGPDVKMMPGPYLASPVGTESVRGAAEPPAGRVTLGRGRQSSLVAGLAQGRVLEGPPKRLTTLVYP
jgi:hypothetical protein